MPTYAYMYQCLVIIQHYFRHWYCKNDVKNFGKYVLTVDNVSGIILGEIINILEIFQIFLTHRTMSDIKGETIFFLFIFKDLFKGEGYSEVSDTMLIKFKVQGRRTFFFPVYSLGGISMFKID